ncbi:MAG: ATP-dependent RecD-like DNA helicase [Lentisphaeria bacterium]
MPEKNPLPLFAALEAAGPAPAAAPGEETVRGEVLRIVFASDDGNYVVLRLHDERGEEQTLVGPFGNIVEGQELEAWGRWEKHREHGRQFRAGRFRTVLPISERGIRRFLASGLIHGIGKGYADRIVDQFGERTLEVLDRYSTRLLEVPGLGRTRLAQIRTAWKELAEKRESLMFLQGLGLGHAFSQRVLTAYGAAAPEVVRRNPYQLASEVQGIGFQTADRIAGELGVAKDSPLRLEAGVVFVLGQLAEQDGHVCCPETVLLEEAARLLEVEPAAAAQGLGRALLDNALVAEPGAADTGRWLYTRRLHAAEAGLADALRPLLAAPPPPRSRQPETGGDRWNRFNDAQRQAVRAAFLNGVSIITGGPGVGKTTVVGEVVAQARRMQMRVLLAAPTGRAAKRMSESCNLEAKTLHRLLKWDPARGAFVHNADTPLRGDLLVVDEVSMLDVELARNLFTAVPAGMRVLLVGDKDQLPSVGPGAVLHDLMACGRIPVTELTHVYRQDDRGRIVGNAHAVNRGEMPDLRPVPREAAADFYWLDQEDPEAVPDLIARMVADRIPSHFGLDPRTDIQVLAPMHKGSCGAAALNTLLQKVLNPGPAPEFHAGERLFRRGDRVMQVANNYDKGVFNGELGRIVGVDAAAKRFTIEFDLGRVEYGFLEADQIRLAYAVTVHKSQGCEFPAVVLPVLTQHYIMLQRNLVYTAMTRARRLLIMVGARRALAMAVHNDRTAQRFTRLVPRLTAGTKP